MKCLMYLSNNLGTVQYKEMMIALLGHQKLTFTYSKQLCCKLLCQINNPFCYYSTTYSTSFFSASQTEYFLSHSSIMPILK